MFRLTSKRRTPSPVPDVHFLTRVRSFIYDSLVANDRLSAVVKQVHVSADALQRTLPTIPSCWKPGFSRRPRRV